MRRSIAVASLVAVCAMGAAIAVADEKVKLLDDCDPTDPAWAPTGGCTLRDGDVTNAEFVDFLFSPLMLPPFSFVIGHQAWRFDPTYLKIESGERVRVRNEGGRNHTFTEVREFGGGRVPPPPGLGLNFGLTTAPECLLAPGEVDPTLLAPGESLKVTGLSEGNHRFQCCFHPWMRTLIKVKPEDADSKGEKKD